MGETETGKPDVDGQEKTAEEGTDTSKENDGADDGAEEGTDADDKNDDEGSSDDEETDDDEDDKKDDKKSSKSTSKKDDKGKKEGEAEDDDKEPPTRKSKVDFITERKERREAKKGAKDKKEPEGDDEEADDDIDPADEKTVGKIVQKHLKPLADRMVADEDDKEVSTFLTANPDFKQYEAKARKYMAHPSRKDVPIEEIFYGVAGKDLLKIGAKRAKIAEGEAKKTKGSGGAGDAGGVKPVAEMSKAELEAKQDEVRRKMADR